MLVIVVNINEEIDKLFQSVVSIHQDELTAFAWVTYRMANRYENQKFKTVLDKIVSLITKRGYGNYHIIKVLESSLLHAGISEDNRVIIENLLNDQQQLS